MIDKRVTARFVRDDGTEFLADGADWLLTAIDGASAAEYELFSQDNAGGDGSTLTGKRVKARDLQLDASTLSITHNPTMRARAVSFFSPKHTYRVYLTYMGTTRWISAELAAFSAPSTKVNIPQTWSALFLAADPYWKSTDDFGQDIASETPRWGFPYMDHPRRGALVSVYNFTREVVFAYDGDVPAYPVITLSADDEVENPKIVKDGAFVRLLDTLKKGDTVVIATAPRNIGITKNGKNVLNKVDRASDFTGLRMQPGTNIVRYEADRGDNQLHVVLQYNKQYLGV